MSTLQETALALKLLKSSKIPLFTCVTSLTWVLHDFLLTIEDEMAYIWPGPWNLGKLLYFWVRYYTIAVCIFDVAQIHSFSKFYPSLTTCVAMDATIRVVGALSLWAVEVVMQVRIYALYGCSKRVGLLNAALFLVSIVGFLFILVHNAQGRAAVIGAAKKLPIPGCPVIHTGIEYAQWIPATAYEGILFGFALFKAMRTYVTEVHGRKSLLGISLYTIVLRDNVMYFFGVTCLLVFNNLMVVSVTKIPWFSYGPFHAAVGIMTVRMLLHLRKALVDEGRTTVAASSSATAGRQRSGVSDPVFRVSARDEVLSWHVKAGLDSTASTAVGSARDFAFSNPGTEDERAAGRGGGRRAGDEFRLDDT